MAGQWVLLHRGIYGLKQSNNLFANDIRSHFEAEGFTPLPSDSSIYSWRNPTDPTLRVIVSCHVDDGFALISDHNKYTSLIERLEHRYGPLSQNINTTHHIGQDLHRAPSGAITLSHETYLRQFLEAVNATSLPPRITPSRSNLFDALTTALALTPMDNKLYQTILGALIHIRTTRPDVLKEIQFLASFAQQPQQGHYEHVANLLAYLNSTISLGCTYYTSEGVILYGHVDASFGVHANGMSHTAHYCTIGKDSAPFAASSKPQDSDVATGSMEAEYIALSLCKDIQYFRRVLEELGWPQTAPTVIYEDNMSAIKLASAPQIQRKSRHIHTKYHNVRNLVANDTINLTHLSTHELAADLMTKSLGPTKFKYFRHYLLNATHAPESTAPT